jgi:hypothetical protein
LDKYKEEGGGFRGCWGHDFLENPRPEWDSFPPEAVNEKDETLSTWLARIAKRYKSASLGLPNPACSPFDFQQSPQAGAPPSTMGTSQALITEVDSHPSVEVNTETRTEMESNSAVSARTVVEPTLSDATKEVDSSAKSEDTPLINPEGESAYSANR